LPAKPCWNLFMAETALPSSVVGPWEWAPLRRLASAWASVDMGMWFSLVLGSAKEKAPREAWQPLEALFAYSFS
jgi:hypothetical protein